MLLILPSVAAFCPPCTGLLEIGTDLIQVKSLQATEDANFTENLRDILNSYRYTENYSAGVFDCMDTCILASRVLHEHGYDPGFMGRFALQGSVADSHLWLSVSDGLGGFAFVETTAFADGRPIIGEIVSARDLSNYSSGYALLNPLKVMQCFGYSEARYLSITGGGQRVQSTSSAPIPHRQEAKDARPWIYQR